MANTDKKIEFDTYHIQGTTWKKEVYLGPKTWQSIEAKAPGKFVDILEAKFTEYLNEKKIDLNK
jgi:hypothetical protein